MKLVYLDNAATSYPKPKEVTEAVTKAIETLGGNPGRASHSFARLAADAVYEGREAVAALFGGNAENVVFTMNATQALNYAIKGLVPKDSHVLISDIEHNATLRPVAALAEHGVSYDVYRTPKSEREKDSLYASLKSKLRQNTSAIIACHRSNILPIENPLTLLGEFAKKHSLLFIVDASQSAGVCEIDIEKCGISALCAPGHKALFGIRGCGFALFGKSLSAERIRPLIEGGSGSDSQSLSMPDTLPERLEAGTLPVEAIAALTAGIGFVRSVGIRTIEKKEAALTAYMKERLLTIPSLRLYMPWQNIGSVALFNLSGKSSANVANILDANGIALREGLHCAPLAHRLSGTLSSGALRASVGYFNTQEDIDALVDTLKTVARSERLY